jgi:hypothetical protein
MYGYERKRKSYAKGCPADFRPTAPQVGDDGYRVCIYI